MPEMMGGGVGLLDYDGDGFQDIFCVQGGSLEQNSKDQPGNRLYRNLRGERFEDVTEKAGVRGSAFGMGSACADFDADGDIDIYVTNVGTNALFRNNGDGTFSDVTQEAGVGDPGWGTSAAFLDYDHDGNLDLFVANYIHWSKDRELRCNARGGQRDYCSPLNYKAPAIDALFRNRGDGTFENVTKLTGIDRASGNGLGVACADFDNDGWPDIYVANDAMPNHLWINQRDGRFKEEAMIRGCAVNYLGVSEAGMGVVAVDLQQNGLKDLFVTHLAGEANRLYINTEGYFMDTVRPGGPGAPSWPLTGFGIGFADFDLDGKLDLYVANGRVKYGQSQLNPNDPYAEPNNLLKGLGNGEFEEIEPSGGTTEALIATSRGLALGDIDNDGDIDICIINRDAPVHLLRNRASSSESNWIIMRLLDRNGVDAIGATVKIEAGGLVQWRSVNPNQGYCSSNDPRVHFGLGATKRVDKAVVKWPDNSEQELGPFEPGRIYTVRQGSGR
ncbi:MAG: CRTAC1 family protein [Verrucomicrobia bacterium]|nr:CRTAC1 family protein [Verrucomicrobiota bacterium]